MEERNKILKEILTWLEYDKQYVYTLNVYALQQGLITEQEALQVKETLDKHYSLTSNKQSKANKYMMKVFEEIGFSKTKVLWNLIDQFPKYIVGKPEDCTFIAHDESNIRKLKVSSIKYYNVINELEKLGYIKKKMINSKMTYKIDFLKIKNMSEKADKIQGVK